MSTSASDPNVGRFVKFLIMDCEDEGPSFTNDLLAAAKTQIKSGNGAVRFLSAGGANGKSASQTASLTNDEVAYACRQALREALGIGGQGSLITIPDFSGSIEI